MIEHVVTLRPPKPRPKQPRPLAAPVLAEPDVLLRLAATAPLGLLRLRLWDKLGRESRDPLKGVRVEIRGDSPSRDVGLEVDRGDLDGCTLTWSIRLQGNGLYRVRMTLIQNGEPVANGDFAYTGEVMETEELSGRFHFRQDAAPEAAVAD